MKIAILSCFYPYRGGIAQFNANLLTELSKTNDVRGFNFTRQYPKFLFPGKTQEVDPMDEAQVVETTPLLDCANPFNWHRAAAAISSWGPDVVIVRYWMSYFAPCLGTVLRKLNCKKIAILDNVIPHEKHFFDKALTKWFLKAVDGNITLCGEVGNDLLNVLPSARYTVIPHPTYTHFGPKITKEIALNSIGLLNNTNGDSAIKNDKVILFFGLIREYKGLDILLEAFKLLDRSYHLIVAGEPYGSFEKYQEIISSYSEEVKNRVHLFLNYIPDSEVKFFFCASDVVVLPYRSATQSGVNAISNFFEVPMIVTDVGGLKESISGKGIVTKENTPESIAIEIQRFFDEKTLRESFIENLRKENQKLSWNNFCNELISFIDTLDDEKN